LLVIRAFGFQKPFDPPRNTTSRKRRSTTTTDSDTYVYSSAVFKLNATSGFSFLLRTRQENGFVALLLDKAAIDNKDTSYQYILIEIENRHLIITAKRSNKQAQIVNTPGTTMVSNGKLLEVMVNSNSLQVDSQSEKLSTEFPLHVNLVFMGGVDQKLYANVFKTSGLDGCIQAVSLGGIFLTNQVLPSSTAHSVTSSGKVQNSCPGRPVCAESPCEFNGECVDKWNDFRCLCQPGYSGKTCSTFGCRLNNTCPDASNCIDVPLTVPPQTRCKFFCLLFYFFLYIYNSQKVNSSVNQ